MMEMLVGLVKWFNDDKGFGQIATPANGEYFLHISNFIHRPKNINIGCPIIFSELFDYNKSRNNAANCRLILNQSDWQLAVSSYLGKNDVVNIEVKGIKGTVNWRTETYSYSILEIVTETVFNQLSLQEIKQAIIEYFDNSLEDTDFVAYCKLIEHQLKNMSGTNHNILLQEIFSHFGKNLSNTIVFETWKHKQFKYIGYNDADDYEIPVEVINEFYDQLGKDELKRISVFSFGNKFCSSFLSSKIQEAYKDESIEISYLKLLLSFLNGDTRNSFDKALKDFIIEKFINEFIKQSGDFGQIYDQYTFSKYHTLKIKLGKEIGEECRERFFSEANKLIDANSAQSFKVELWQRGIIESISFELIEEYILLNDILDKTKRSVLVKLSLDEKISITKSFVSRYSFEKAYLLVETLLIDENVFDNNFKLKDNIFDTAFWSDKKGTEVLYWLNEYTEKLAPESNKLKLFFLGLYPQASNSTLLEHALSLTRAEFVKVFEGKVSDPEFVSDILVLRINSSRDKFELQWLYQLAKKYLHESGFNLFDKIVFNKIDETSYFNLWCIGVSNIVPIKYINSQLTEDYNNYLKFASWLNSNIITRDEVASLLISNLKKQEEILDRKTFYRHFNHVKYLLALDESYFNTIEGLNNKVYNIFLWFLDKKDYFDFEVLKEKFIYFSPEEQVRIIRKLFSLKAKGLFNFSIQKLNELRRFDLDLYQTNLRYNPELSIDISTDVIITALLNFSEKGSFLVEGELLSLVLNNLSGDKKKRFKLDIYFETCKGRQIAEYDWATNGKINKVFFGSNQFYYAFEFEFEQSLVDRIKAIPGRMWNNEKRFWGVPSQYEAEVFSFARENKFFLNLDGNHYANNGHLVQFVRKEVPNGVSFCEGRLANKSHVKYNKEFWWCTGGTCFQKCETTHTEDNWQVYTLLDFCKILLLNTDERNHMKDLISNGEYYKFIGLINRFNRLLDRLYCEECNEILFPVETAHFAAYNVVNFCCKNEGCNKKYINIYLNHCLNGQCNSIIDSRISKRCRNGLLICSNCGSCCSHAMLQRRLSNLELTGGSIHPNLIECVNKKLGHLERAEYFCYKCNNEMIEVTPDVFECANDGVKYDTTKFKFKREHRYLRTSNNSNPDSFYNS